MKKIHIKPWRDLIQMKGRGILIALIIGGGVAIYSGGYMARDTFFHTRDTYFHDLHLADLEVSIDPSTEEELPPLDNLEGVQAMTRCLISLGSIELEDGRPLTTAIVYLDPAAPPEVNSLKILQGTYLSPDDNEGVVIERSLAEYHGYKVGDRITLNPYSFPQEVTVKGIAISPKFILPTANPDVLIPSKGSLGVIYASRELVEDFFGYQLYNNFTFLFSPDGDRKNYEEEINKIFSPLNIRFFIRKTEQFSYRFLEQDLKGVGVFIPATVIVFGILAAIVIALAVNRLVQSQLKEIGGLMALGYSPFSILVSYLILGLILGIAGGCVGLAGSFWIRHIFTTKYSEVVGLPPLIDIYPASHLIKGFVFGVIVTLASTALPLLRIVGLLPREALSGGMTGGFTFRRTFLSESTLLSPSTLFGLRNLFRRPGLTASTILLMALAISLSTAFIITHSTVEHFADTSFSREDWDALALFRTPLEKKDFMEITSTPGVDRWHPMIHGAVTLTTQRGDSAHFGLVGNPTQGYMRRFKFLSGQWLSSDSAWEIVINNNFYTLPHIRVGDTITVTAKNKDYSFTIVGLVSDMTMGVAFAPIETVRGIMDLQGKASGFLVASHLPPEDLKKALFTHEMINYISLKSEMKEQVREALAQVRTVVNVAIGISIFMAILFLISSLTINILERETEYATLGALGYSQPSVARIVLTEVMTEALCALVLSIPISILVSLYLNHEMARAWFQIDLYLNSNDFLTVMIPAFLATPLASIPGLKTVFSLNLPEVLRRRAFG